MIEAVVVAEWIVAGIVGRVDINAFDFGGENFFERGEREEVVALDDKIVVVGKSFGNLRGVFWMADGICKNFGLKQSVNVVTGEQFVVENFCALLVVGSLSAFEDAIFVRKNQRDFILSGNQIVVFVDEPDFVFEAGVAVGEELSIVDCPSEFDFVEDFHAGNVLEKIIRNIFFWQEQTQKFFVGIHSRLENSIAQKISVVGKKSFVAFQKLKQSVKEFLHVICPPKIFWYNHVDATSLSGGIRQKERRCCFMFDMFSDVTVNVLSFLIGMYIYDHWFK